MGIAAGCIGLPDLHFCARDRLAVFRQDPSGQIEDRTLRLAATGQVNRVNLLVENRQDLIDPAAGVEESVTNVPDFRKLAIEDFLDKYEAASTAPATNAKRSASL